MRLSRVICTTLCLLSCVLASAQAEHRIAVIRAEVPGSPFTQDASYLDSLLVEVNNYFNEQLSESYLFERVADITLGSEVSNETTSIAVAQACRLANSSVDFNLYDTDLDNKLEALVVYFSGSAIWPQTNYLTNVGITLRLDHVLINPFCAFSEMMDGQLMGMGPICHEYLHTRGLKDFYDTDKEGSDGLSECLWGVTSLMDRGDHNDSTRTPPFLNAVELNIIGEGVCDTLKVGAYNLKSIDKEERYLFMPTDTEGEYYLFECRNQADRDSLIGGSGMLVYHVDRSTRKTGFSSYYNVPLTGIGRWDRNEVNCRPDHQCVDLIEACADADTVSSVFFPGECSRVLGSDTNPAIRFWSGQHSHIALHGITLEADGSVSFKVIEPIREHSSVVFQDMAILEWELDELILPVIDSCSITWTTPDGEQLSRKLVNPNASGILSQNLTGLESNTSYSVEVMAYTSEGNYSFTSEVTTRKVDKRNTTPFIYLIGAEREKDGSFKKGVRFPLYVYNAIDAMQIVWTFNGSTPELDEKGYYEVTSSGILRAELYFEDGSCDVISKEIVAR